MALATMFLPAGCRSAASDGPDQALQLKDHGNPVRCSDLSALQPALRADPATRAGAYRALRAMTCDDADRLLALGWSQESQAPVRLAILEALAERRARPPLLATIIGDLAQSGSDRALAPAVAELLRRWYPRLQPQERQFIHGELDRVRDGELRRTLEAAVVPPSKV